MTSNVTVVLVHGALTGASVWDGVSQKLQATGLNTIAPAMPLRSLQSDANYLAAFIKTLDGPVVIAGHSYAGSVMSHPAIASDKLKALVFVAGFALEAGESTGELNGRWPGSLLSGTAVTIRPSPDGDELYLRPDRFQEVYANDLPQPTAALLAAAQRPITVSALGDAFRGRAAWHDIPSWTVLSTKDNSLPSEAQRFMAKRANSVVTEIAASHASPVSQPQAVADVIAEAVRQAST